MGSKLLMVFVCIYSSVHATPVNQDEVQVQNSPLDVSTGRFVEVQNASLVITYTGIIVAIVMMASFLSIAAYYSTGEQYRNFKTKRSLLHSGLDDVGRILDEALLQYNYEDEEEIENDFFPWQYDKTRLKIRRNRRSKIEKDETGRKNPEKDGTREIENPKKDGTRGRENPENVISCVEYEEFCKLGFKVRQNNLQIGEALPLVYSALGRSGNQDFRSSLSIFLSGLQGRNCSQKPDYCK